MIQLKRPVSHKLVIAVAEIFDGLAMLLLLGFPNSIGFRLRAIL